MARPTPNTYLKDALYNLSTQGIAVDDITPLYALRNFARRQYMSEYRWGFRSATATLVVSASTSIYSAPSPSTIDERFPAIIYDIYNGERRNYDRVEYGQLFESTVAPRFYGDRLNQIIYLNQSASFIDYQVTVADLAETSTPDLNPDVFPDTTAISWLLAGMYVNSLETADDLNKASYFEGKYSAQLGADIAREAAYLPRISLSMPMTGRR